MEDEINTAWKIFLLLALNNRVLMTEPATPLRCTVHTTARAGFAAYTQKIQMASILPLKEAVTMWLWQQFPARIVQFCPEAKVSTHVKQTICKREIIFCPAYGITGKVSFMCEQEVALQLMTRATLARW